jgi:2-oxo-4-hydroxy-4-carboxy-5-ureidoimidazoline decarboxylase
MPNTRISVSDLNTLDQEAFVAALTFVFEGPPWIVREAWHNRPFADLTQLHQALCFVMENAPVEQHIALIRSHPDLVGDAALNGTLTSASANEQAAAGLDKLSSEEIVTFQELNQRYRTTFGFPFVICARENKKASILAGFATRLHNSREEEIRTALSEIAKIADLRLRDFVIDVPSY